MDEWRDWRNALVSDTVIYLEGGGDSNEGRARCREGFRKLLESCRFGGRLPRLFACGGRNAAFDNFKTAHSTGEFVFVAMWIDSEDPIVDVERVWDHLKQRDGWKRPKGAQDDQVLLMTTCMETWIVADRKGLSDLYQDCLQLSALPPRTNIESKPRDVIQDSLTNATKNCRNAYLKNKRSFESLANVNPNSIRDLPSFARLLRILEEKLPVR